MQAFDSEDRREVFKEIKAAKWAWAPPGPDWSQAVVDRRPPRYPMNQVWHHDLLANRVQHLIYRQESAVQAANLLEEYLDPELGATLAFLVGEKPAKWGMLLVPLVSPEQAVYPRQKEPSQPEVLRRLQSREDRLEDFLQLVLI